MKDKIIEHFVNADYNTMTQGLMWYEKAHNEAVLLSQVFEVPLNKVVGVISALSPRNKWARNLSDAWDLLDNPSMETKVCTFGSQKQKALDIYTCDGADETIMSILNGTKTVNFYHNIMYYNNSDAVTVDLWAFRSVGLTPNQKHFYEVHDAYVEAANEIGIQPNQLQAVVWTHIRGKAI